PDPKAPPRADIALAREVQRQLPAVRSGKELADLFAAQGWDKFVRAIPSLKERSKTLAELVSGALFIVAERPLKLEDKAAKLLGPEGRASNAEVLKLLTAVPSEEWVSALIEAKVKSFVDEKALKLGNVAQPLRAALTGRSVSPPVFDVLEVLGRDESLARIADASA
ncbi:MAG: glutamate--tRNA ligase, partial [Hyphomicrobium sp.]